MYRRIIIKVYVKIFMLEIFYFLLIQVPLRPFVGDVDRFVGDFGNGSDFSSASSFPISLFSSPSFFSVSSSAFSFSSGSGLSSVFVSAASADSSSSGFSFSPSSFFSS